MAERDRLKLISQSKVCKSVFVEFSSDSGDHQKESAGSAHTGGQVSCSEVAHADCTNLIRDSSLIFD
ncbi:hypothetical protein F2P79_002257 [Pimephales promelas]|nr:hypothetical protein F2P79_002257 [Pimephales promelas]